jgi:hypothetical protein
MRRETLQLGRVLVIWAACKKEREVLEKVTVSLSKVLQFLI